MQITRRQHRKDLLSVKNDLIRTGQIRFLEISFIFLHHVLVLLLQVNLPLQLTQCRC